jgi:hypothetical protein
MSQDEDLQLQLRTAIEVEERQQLQAEVAALEGLLARHNIPRRRHRSSA